jgi:hypothetical protein
VTKTLVLGSAKMSCCGAKGTVMTLAGRMSSGTWMRAMMTRCDSCPKAARKEDSVAFGIVSTVQPIVNRITPEGEDDIQDSMS